jgi:hypothetical protein
MITREEVLNLAPGQILDELVARHVLGWEYIIDGEGEGWVDKEGHFVEGFNVEETLPLGAEKIPPPPFSSNKKWVWTVIEKIAPLVGDFVNADGFFYLVYADSADMSLGETCTPLFPSYLLIESDDSDDKFELAKRWCCHIHVGLIGGNSECPATWDHDDDFCVVELTPELAVSKAALISVLSKEEQ